MQEPKQHLQQQLQSQQQWPDKHQQWQSQQPDEWQQRQQETDEFGGGWRRKRGHRCEQAARDKRVSWDPTASSVRCPYPEQ